LVKKRFDAIGLDALLVYLIDTVDESALYYLAWQFDVLGYKGLHLATTTQQKRELIKKSIELHRFKGTVWAIKEALSAIGFPNAVVTEHITHWATFKVVIDIGLSAATPQIIADVERMINEYKNARSHLYGIEFSLSFGDDITIIDESFDGPATQDNDNISVGGDFRYNGEFYYNGSKNYSSDTDVLELTITP
jgi:phage tail P2-like protein